MNMIKLMKFGAVMTAAAMVSPAVAQDADDAPPAEIERIVVFGDSLSDGGFFASILPLPPGAGQFTTNPDPVAVEVTAAEIGLDVQTAYSATPGTNFAVGGARVTEANGFSIPIATQLGGFQATDGFNPGDLVYIQGGANDFFEFGDVFVMTGVADFSILTTAAAELNGLVSQISDAGPGRLVVLNIQSGGMGGIQFFNDAFEMGLAASGVNALFFDTDQLFNEIIADPAEFGFTNITDPACTTPSSLSCTRDTLVEPNAQNTFALADDVHPTGATQRIQGQAIASVIQAPEQIAGLNQSAQSAFRAQRFLAEAASRGVAAREGTKASIFGAISYHDFDNGSTAQRIGASEDGFVANLGVDVSLGDSSGIGASIAYGEGNGDFSSNGDYDVNYYSVTAYGRTSLGPLNLVLDGTYGQSDYGEINRVFNLGPSVRTHTGETDGEYYAVRLSAQADLINKGSFSLGPDVALQIERTQIDGFTEAGGRSTDLTFEDQDIDSFTGRVGLAGRLEQKEGGALFARVGYEREFNGDPQQVTIRTTDAPISFTSTVSSAGRNYMSYAVGGEGSLGGGISARFGFAGEAFRSDREEVTAYAGISVAF